ncbi:hypothetical protein [Hymenobacter sediminicola]|uniref:Uncharacterized protein n=1 Tax=Hymenobacter sediminicola TaxID=2761579 RepID=A0A7G7W5D1_9BACT|nr:hypothetical protein [Hymenobacter sediminicola]QNH61574.1 hypothetical protein H4317_15635 [Hymenobacter sediminicola]
MALLQDFPQNTSTNFTYVMNRLIEARQHEKKFFFAQDGVIIEYYKKGFFSTKVYKIVIENIVSVKTGESLEVEGKKVAGITFQEGQAITQCTVLADKLIPVLQEIPEAFFHILGIWNSNTKPDFDWNPEDWAE